MDGIQVLKRLRADPDMRDVPVMMYSASGDAAMEREAARLGAVDCVLKSGGFPALFDRVEACLDGSGSSAGATPN